MTIHADLVLQQLFDYSSSHQDCWCNKEKLSIVQTPAHLPLCCTRQLQYPGSVPGARCGSLGASCNGQDQVCSQASKHQQQLLSAGESVHAFCSCICCWRHASTTASHPCRSWAMAWTPGTRCHRCFSFLTSTGAQDAALAALSHCLCSQPNFTITPDVTWRRASLPGRLMPGSG